MIYHQPVLLDEVISTFNPQPSDIFIDATAGHGGHSLALLKHQSIVHCLDADQQNIKILSQRFTKQNISPSLYRLHHTNFSSIFQIYHDFIYPKPVKGILFDLGLNSLQLNPDSHQGFSFHDPSSLDMRLDPTKQTLTASDIINQYPPQKLADLFSRYSQERLAKPLASQIARRRQQKPFTTSLELSEFISQISPQRPNQRLHPATKVFLALRIEVNQELTILSQTLSQLPDFPRPLIVCLISFHSGEDRIVKQFVRQHRFPPVSKPQPIVPQAAEISQNPLSRSAKLRSFIIT